MQKQGAVEFKLHNITHKKRESYAKKKEQWEGWPATYQNGQQIVINNNLALSHQVDQTTP